MGTTPLWTTGFIWCLFFWSTEPNTVAIPLWGHWWKSPAYWLVPTACINIRYSTPWTPTRKLPSKTGRNLVTDTSEWLQPVPQRSLECLSPLCHLQKRKKHSELWDRHTEDMTLPSSKWETIPSRPKTDANAISGNSPQPAESILKSSEQTVPHLTKSNKKPNDGPLTLRLKFQGNS